MNKMVTVEDALLGVLADYTDDKITLYEPVSCRYVVTDKNVLRKLQDKLYTEGYISVYEVMKALGFDVDHPHEDKWDTYLHSVGWMNVDEKLFIGENELA